MAIKRYLVTYDVSDATRLRKVARILEGAGDRRQLSVFVCDLSDRLREELVSRLTDVVHMTEDQVLIVELGPARDSTNEVFSVVGRSFEPPSSRPLVV